jgi:non-heme chloroperoxidase
VAIKAHYDCIKAFSETDFTEDLKSVDVPVLVMHGEDDQIVPFALTDCSQGCKAFENTES